MFLFGDLFFTHGEFRDALAVLNKEKIRFMTIIQNIADPRAYQLWLNREAV